VDTLHEFLHVFIGFLAKYLSKQQIAHEVYEIYLFKFCKHIVTILTLKCICFIYNDSVVPHKEHSVLVL